MAAWTPDHSRRLVILEIDLADCRLWRLAKNDLRYARADLTRLS
jgi:hypothetical protein